MFFLLTGCTSATPVRDKGKVDGPIEPCVGEVDCPLPEEKKQAILGKLKESGKADEIVEAIENGEIRMYEINDAVREKYEEYIGKDSIALRDGNNIYIDPNASDAVAAASTAHEGTHVLDKSPFGTHADTFRREMKAHNKQADVWKTLKKQDPSLEDLQNDTIVERRNNGTLDDHIKKKYGLSL